ncbi:MAG: YraN family protein, partial [Myxococcales bacterium]|nr:YraN family protein [Myxococcales bacterium]
MSDKLEIAARAEEAVAALLVKNGYTLLARNARVGRLEIDIIAKRGRQIVFCEVRSRSSARFGSPVETIAGPKAARIRRAAAGWLRANKV